MPPRRPITPVPGAVMARLRPALATRQHWQPPVHGAVRTALPLRGGLSNHNVLVQCGTQWLVVRLDRIDPQLNQLDRAMEFEIMHSAARHGLAPTPRHVDPAKGVLVHDYVGALPPAITVCEDHGRRYRVPPGEHCDRTRSAVGALLRAIHRLPRAGRRLRLAEQLAHYQRLAGQAGQGLSNASPWAQAALRHARRLDEDHSAPVLCHNDLLPDNRVWHRGRLLALDWEYAAIGSRWFDLAAAADRASVAAAGQLLRAYLQRDPHSRERALFLSARYLHAYLDRLWRQTNLGAAARTDDPAMMRDSRLATLWEHAGQAWRDTGDA